VHGSDFLNTGVKIIQDDPSGLVALNKPEGLLSHPNSNKAEAKAAIRLPYDHQQQAYVLPDQKLIYLLNRLDSPTSGIILCTTNRSLSEHVAACFLDQRVQKTYYAWVHGRLQRPQVWVDQLHIQKKGHQLRTSVRAGGIISKTKVVPLKIKGPYSLIALTPITGRTHQLRVQSAQHGYPIIGDRTYGNFQANRLFEKQTHIKRLLLHATAIQLPLPSGQMFHAHAPIPDAFA